MNGSRVLRLLEAGRWESVPVTEYKSDATQSWCGITRSTLVGGRGETTTFQLRYFEIEPGGFSSREHHQHEHAVFVVRGAGEVQLGNSTQPIRQGDVVYVAPNDVHQFRNPATATEPLGFLCIVDAVRDPPVTDGGTT